MPRRKRFGTLPEGTAVEVLTLRAGGVEVDVITYGCIITALRFPDRSGSARSVVLGYGHLEGYLKESPYFGALVGRYANRIAGARFSIGEREFRLSANEPPNHLHGGFTGFDKRVWTAEYASDSRAVELRRRSPDGEEGYPGNLDVSVVYRVSEAGLLVHCEATTDVPTHVNLTQHSYFNLRGSGDTRDHQLVIDADAYLPVDERLIPTGEMAAVSDTPFDFRTATSIGGRGRTYDHNFVLNDRARTDLAACVLDPDTGRTLEVRTTAPGLQFYSGASVDFRGFCLEPQHFPDTPNRPAFPSTLVRPGEKYVWATSYTFALEPSDRLLAQPGIG